jgi:hypothetical protein
LTSSCTWGTISGFISGRASIQAENSILGVAQVVKIVLTIPMARAIVSGLSFSTAVTLLILPTIYILMDNLRNWSQDAFHFASGRTKQIDV